MKKANTKTKPTWDHLHAKAALAEGWALCMVVNEGKPVKQWFYMAWPIEGSQLATRHNVERLIADRAKKGSALHIHAMSVIVASRLPK